MLESIVSNSFEVVLCNQHNLRMCNSVIAVEIRRLMILLNKNYNYDNSLMLK